MCGAKRLDATAPRALQREGGARATESESERSQLALRAEAAKVRLQTHSGLVALARETQGGERFARGTAADGALNGERGARAATSLAQRTQLVLRAHAAPVRLQSGGGTLALVSDAKRG